MNNTANNQPQGYTYDQALSAIQKIVSILGPDNKDKICIAGGLVPWLIINKTSPRLHGDVDIIVKDSDLPAIRELLKESTKSYEAGVPEANSELMTGNEDEQTKKDGFVVNLSVETYTVKIVFYSFSFNEMEGTIKINTPRSNQPFDLRPIEFKGLNPNDFTRRAILPNGQDVAVLAPEIIYLIITGFFDGAEISLEQQVKNSKDMVALNQCINHQKLVAITNSGASGAQFAGAGDQATQGGEEKGVAYTKSRRAAKSAAYVDALILAFITGIVGGFFLFIFLKAIQ